MALLPLILQSLFALSQYPESRRFACSIKSSKRIQEKILAADLRKNQATLFGKEHGFKEIADIATYRTRVPIRSYHEFLPYIEQIQQGQQRILTAEDVLLFHPTGGTTGTKLIPYTRALKSEFQKALAPWLFDVFRNFPAILHGRTYWTITPPGQRQKNDHEQNIHTGFEEDASYFGWQGYFLQHLFAVPSWVTLSDNIENFRFLTLFFLLQAKNLRWISIWSPTFFLVLLDELTRNADRLLSSLFDGVLRLPEREHEFPSWEGQGVGKKRLEQHETLEPTPNPFQEGNLAASPLRNLLLKASNPSQERNREMKKRARELERLLALPVKERYERIWPQLAFISLWKDAYARYPAQKLESLFPNVYFQGKGLLATEGVMSIPLYDAARKDSSGCLPAFTSHFLEFFSDEDNEARCLWELQEGKTYSIILTTGGGLYRYDIGDLVTVEGWYHELPLLRLIGRKGRFCDLAGEKLEESFVTQSLENALMACPVSFSFLLIAPEKWDDTQGYVLFIETPEAKTKLLALSRQLERLLCANVHYEFAVKMGQIEPLTVFLVQQDGQKNYLKRCMASGQKMGDIKPLSFDPRPDWEKVFNGDFLYTLYT